MNPFTVNLDLVQKYNVPGPRYTSYPPAPQFSDQFTWPEIAAKVAQSQNATRGLSLYFHLPFCESLCWYCGCTTVITTQREKSAIYLQYLEKEMALMSERLNHQRQVVQLHWGGGTPTFLSPAEIRQLGASIKKYFDFAPDLEAGVEIDPRRLTPDHMAALREAGFNRVSIGVQDFNPVVQEAVHRIQPKEQTENAIRWARHEGFQSINVDLIYGLPFQTVETFDRTLDEVITLEPDRLAVFSYAHVPWIKPAQKNLTREAALPSAETKLNILKLAVEKLTCDDRYTYIGMDHFARPNDELAIAQRQKTLQRNFQGYSAKGGADIYAFGMSSISQADGVYWQNLKDLPSYYAALDQDLEPFAKGYVLSADDKIRRHTIMRLMCDLSLDYAALSQSLHIDFAAHFAPELDSLSDLEKDGLLQRYEHGLVINEAGRLFLRNVAMRFDRYLPAAKERRFSQTI
ncbi:MAG TPA: oxygen-independent coproporphyrinogen III oxidase [Verrucomicrobiae bacterium]|jgi:oxygen-independent coproporphyrinogen-3 oxidase|nr:oxygen-independent coproporphyrinogen III oxidase [Verrucomicrobiae bacterium]